MSYKRTLDRAIKQATDLEASIRLIEKTIGPIPNAQREVFTVLARLETLRDLKTQQTIDRVSNRIED